MNRAVEVSIRYYLEPAVAMRIGPSFEWPRLVNDVLHALKRVRPIVVGHTE